MTTKTSSKVTGWTGGGKRGAAARRYFNLQREANARDAGKAHPHAGKTIERWADRYNGSVIVHFTDGSWAIFASKRRALQAIQAR